MNLAIIFPDKEGWTVDRFRESAESRGIEVRTVAVTDELIARGRVDDQIQQVDAVLWKFADATLAGFLASYPILKDKPLINTGVVLMPSATDKFLQQQLLARSSLREHALTTFRVHSKDHARDLVNEGVLSYPLVIKPAWGTNAQNVYIIRSDEDLNKVGAWHSQIAEPFISSTEEWRVFVIGGVVAGIMKKHRRDGVDPDATIIGGGARNVAEDDMHLSAQLADIAERVASLFHLEYAGIDIVRDRHTGRLYVYEANSAAGWQNGFVEATGEDIPGQVLDWFEERWSLHRHEEKAQAVEAYLRRRSHRLPLIDELLLISNLIMVRPDGALMRGRQQLMGEEYEYLRAAIQREVDDHGVAGIIRAQDLLQAIGMSHTVERRKILGDELYEVIFNDKHALQQPLGQDITVDTLAEWVRYVDTQTEDKGLIRRIDAVIKEYFMQIPLKTLLHFCLVARRSGDASDIEEMIIGRAESSVTWAGNFLIDDQQNTVGISTDHTLRQGYLQSVYYIQLKALASKSNLQH